MKRTSLFMTVMLTVLTSSFSDVIPVGMHPVENRVLITSAGDYSLYKLIGYIQGVNGNDSAYIIENSVPLFKGYKFNRFSVFAIPASLLDSCGGVGGLDFKAITGQLNGASIVDPSGTCIDDSDPLIKDTYYYSVESIHQRHLILKLDKRIKHFSDGRADEIEVY
jgi:hypothetical protein